MIVDHTNPIHDQLCRCSSCKPSLVGERSGTIREFKLTLVFVTFVAAIFALFPR